VDCIEFEEQISPAVDRLLQREAMDSFVQHAQLCPSCRNEYELESITKTLICNKAKMVRPPGDLVQSISGRLEREERATSTETKGRWKSIVASPRARPALAIVGGCIVVLLLFIVSQRTPDLNPPAVNPLSNVINQSLANYQAVVSGAIQPQHVSNNPEHLISFFAGKTDFPVLVPQLTGCTLVGGVLNEHAGTTLAHVVYMHEGNIVYMYEACWETVRNGQKLHLPQAIKEGLLRTGWFAETHPDGKTVVLWTKGNTLCAAVARMNKEELLACLSSREENQIEVW
jgi:hypothetical protein